jgi:hypothetical protein
MRVLREMFGTLEAQVRTKHSNATEQFIRDEIARHERVLIAAIIVYYCSYLEDNRLYFNGPQACPPGTAG